MTKLKLTESQLRETIKNVLLERGGWGGMDDFERKLMKQKEREAEKEKKRQQQATDGIVVKSEKKKSNPKKKKDISATSFETAHVNELIEKLQGIFEYRGKHNTSDKYANAIKRFLVVYVQMADKNSEGGAWLTRKNWWNDERYRKVYIWIQEIRAVYYKVQSYLKDYGKLDRYSLTKLSYYIMELAEVLPQNVNNILEEPIIKHDKSKFMMGDGKTGKNPGFKPTLQLLKNGGASYLSGIVGDITRLQDELSENDVMNPYKIIKRIYESVIKKIKNL